MNELLVVVLYGEDEGVRPTRRSEHTYVEPSVRRSGVSVSSVKGGPCLRPFFLLFIYILNPRNN